MQLKKLSMEHQADLDPKPNVPRPKKLILTKPSVFHQIARKKQVTGSENLLIVEQPEP